jgi:hypothetical protein
MSGRIRITGLVRLADTVRRGLGGAINPQQRDRLRERVAQSLEQVGQIIADAGTHERSLPQPSRRALQFLRSIDWNSVAVSDSAPAPGRGQLAFPGLGGFVERALNRLAQPLATEEVESVRESIARTSRQIEGTIERHNASPREIAPSARPLRGWLAFMARPEDFAAYRAAVVLAGRKLVLPQGAPFRFPRPLLVYLRPMRGIYRLSPRPGGSILQLPTGCIAFGEGEFADLASMVLAQNRDARRRVIEHMTSEGFQSIQAELESLSGIVTQPGGAFHDLAASFDRVNAKYFAGAMPPPRLTWSRSFTGRKFGHYDWILDTVMVSRTLDAQDVPAFVVDFIMYHELLHKKHGLRWVEGRGYAHTADFQRDERRFEQHQQAEEIIDGLARGQRPKPSATARS